MVYFIVEMLRKMCNSFVLFMIIEGLVIIFLVFFEMEIDYYYSSKYS